MALLFHVFSEKTYIYSGGDKGDSRLESLSRMFGISDRVFRSYDDFITRQKDVNSSIKYIPDDFFKLLEESKAFLFSATKSIGE